MSIKKNKNTTRDAGREYSWYQKRFAPNCGSENIVSGVNSSACGFQNTILGDSSAAYNCNNTVIGNCSFACNSMNRIEADNAFAKGKGNTILGHASSGEGMNNRISGEASHGQGIFTEAGGGASHSGGKGFNDSIRVKADGLASFNHSIVDEHYTGTGASGEASFIAGGINNEASGAFSYAEGMYAKASGSMSHSQGNSTTASGYVSNASGNNTTASGHMSHSQGNGTIANGPYSHAEGLFTISSGEASHAEGVNTIAGYYSEPISVQIDSHHSLNWYDGENDYLVTRNNLTGLYPQALIEVAIYAGHTEFDIIYIGSLTPTSVIEVQTALPPSPTDTHIIFSNGELTALLGGTIYETGYLEQNQIVEYTGNNSHAQGNSTIAAGDNSFSAGNNTKATGMNSTAFGDLTTASGAGSHAEGNATTASGEASHTEGAFTKAIGINSHAEGNRANAYLTGMHAKSSGYDGGNSQYGNVTVGCDTADTTKTELEIVGGVPITFRDNTLATFRIMGIGSDRNGNIATYEIKGSVKTLAGVCTLATAPVVTELHDDFTCTGMTVGTDGISLIVYAEGIDALQIRWTAFVEWQELLLPTKII